MTIESSVAALTTANTLLTSAVLAAKADLTAGTASFAATTARVSTGLNNVSNTSDANKPVSTAQQAALDTKQPTLDLSNLKTVNGVDLRGAGNVLAPRGPTSINGVSYDERNSLRLTLTPAVDDTRWVDGLGIFSWVADLPVPTDNQPDEDETCFATAAVAGRWLLIAPAPELLDAWASAARSELAEYREDEPIRMAAYFATKGL